MTRTYPQPLQGKTYSLQDFNASSDAYYAYIADSADACLRKYPDISDLIARLRRLSRTGVGEPLRRQALRKLLPEAAELESYTSGVRAHLRNLSWRQLSDRRLWTRTAQYHLYMLEIELVNRVNRNRFRECRRRIALLPHCLRDFTRECRAESDGFDYVCRRCSKICAVRRLSEFLQARDIKLYIWMEADFRRHARRLRAQGESLGIVGIACIPELAWGLRRCDRAGIPAVGAPLDANRCARWMGEFLPNAVNLAALERLVGPSCGEPRL